MAFLCSGSLHEYEVKIVDTAGNVHVNHILAKDVETAAFNALELSSRRNCKLKDVRMCDEW